MKNLGKWLCILGSIIALLFPPFSYYEGISFRFIFGNPLGNPLYNFSYVHKGILILELILINGLGLAMVFLGKKNN